MPARIPGRTAGIAVLVAATVAVGVAVGVAATRRSARDADADTFAPATSSSSAASSRPAALGPGGFPVLPPGVDLVALRTKTPDNLYWTLAAPTTDAAEQERRAVDERAKRALFVKVQSHTANDGEIVTYYEQQQRLASDHAELARAILADPGAQLTADDRALHEATVRRSEPLLKKLEREETLNRGRRRAYETQSGLGH